MDGGGETIAGGEPHESDSDDAGLRLVLTSTLCWSFRASELPAQNEQGNREQEEGHNWTQI